MKLKVVINKQNSIYFLLSFFLALIISLIRWEKINPLGYFYDRSGYIFSYIFKSNKVERFEVDNAIDYVTNEWLWKFINDFAKQSLNLTPELFLGIITFLAFLTYSYFILINTRKPIVLIYLLNIEFISFIYSQLRLALAMSLFIIAIQCYKNKKSLIAISLFISSVLIHTSLSIFIGLLFLSHIIAIAKIRPLKKIIFIFLVGLLVNLLIGPLRELILSEIGDRRAEYGDFTPPIYWYLIYILYTLTVFTLTLRYKLPIFNNYIHVYAFIIFSLLISSLVLGGYTSRFVVATTLFIIPSLFILKGKAGILFQYIYIVYLIFLWIGFLT